MQSKPLSSEDANNIYDILVCSAGAHEGYRSNFIAVQTDKLGCAEFRFCGKLGFGGKFWINAGQWYINCYTEDQTPERKKIIAITNRRLTELKYGVVGDDLEC